MRVTQVLAFALITGAIWSVQRERGEVSNPIALAVVGFFGAFVLTVVLSIGAAMAGNRASLDWLRSLWDLPPLGRRKPVRADNLDRQ